MRRLGIVVLAIASLVMGVASQAGAAGQVEIGGKKSVTAAVSVSTTDTDLAEDDFTTMLISGSFGYTTQNGRHEFAGALSVFGVFSDSADLTVWLPNAQYRINSNLLGPNENVLVYIGAVAGAGFIDFDAGSDGEFDDQYGAFGPKVGAEFYVSPTVAVQIEDVFLFDTEDGTTNALTIGLKVLFE
jgi:hypothetical protein